jgi:hypothetical protein
VFVNLVLFFEFVESLSENPLDFLSGPRLPPDVEVRLYRGVVFDRAILDDSVLNRIPVCLVHSLFIRVILLIPVERGRLELNDFIVINLRTALDNFRLI